MKMQLNKPLKVFLFVIIGPVFFLNAAIFLFLNTPIFHKAVSLNPNSAIVDFTLGVPLGIPGLVYLRGLHLEVQDSNVHLKINLKNSFGFINLLKLKKKQLNFSKLNAYYGDVNIYVRTPKEHDKYVKENPDTGPPNPKEIWKLMMPNISISRISRTQVANMVMTGNGKVRGGFYLWPGIEAEIFKSCIEVENGKLENWADPFNLKGCLEISKFSAPKVDGNEVFDYATLNTHISGRALTYLALQEIIDKSGNVSFEGAPSPFEGHVEIIKGYLSPKSFFKLNAQEISVNGPAFFMKGKLLVDWTFKPDSHRLNLDFSDLKVFRKTQDHSLGGIGKLPLILESNQMRILYFLSTYNLYFKAHDFCFKNAANRSKNQETMIDTSICGFLEGKSAGAKGLLTDLNLNGQWTMDQFKLNARKKSLEIFSSGKWFLNSSINLPDKKLNHTKILFITDKEKRKIKKSEKTQVVLDPGWNMKLLLSNAKWEKNNFNGSASLIFSDNNAIVNTLSELDIIGFPITTALKSKNVSLGTDFKVQNDPFKVGFHNVTYKSGNGLKGTGELLLDQKIYGRVKVNFWPLSLGVKIHPVNSDVEWFPDKGFLKVPETGKKK